LFRRVGSHLAEDISNIGYRAGPAGDWDQTGAQAGIDRAAFDTACARLAACGYGLVPADLAWPAFEAARAEYATRLEAMATYWATPSTSWLGTAGDLRSPAHREDDARA